MGNGEVLIVSLDTYLDRRTAYTFGVTAAGVRIDYFHPIDHEYERDFTFDPVWEAETEIGESGLDGGDADPLLAAPLQRRRGSRSWGLNINRWVPVGQRGRLPGADPARRDRLVVAASADLVGIESHALVAAHRDHAVRGELGDVHQRSARRPGRSVRGRRGTWTPAWGPDFKMGLGPNLTLDATVNPDFGQVEADPAEVNLTAFETFFEERRPFFTEGQDNCSRATGRRSSTRAASGASPHGQADGDFVDTPRTTTILGAAKLTGGWRRV